MFLILAVAPRGLIGAVAAILTSGSAMDFVAVLKVLALIGILIRNAVIANPADRGAPARRMGTCGSGPGRHDASNSPDVHR
ncbi:MAG TPA: hypothetical protein VGI85_00090, partial [Chthoniobacterales bacterium]